MDETNAKPTPAVTQEMIALYDDYTHISLDRRKFMDNLAILAGSHAAALSIAGLMAADAHAAGLSAEDDPKLTIETVTYKGANGTMSGYQAMPKAGGPFGAVIVIHENRGLNAHIKDVTRRMALEGFVALAPDFLSDQGGTPADEDKARDLFAKINVGDVVANAVATVAYLKGLAKANGKVGAIGFCWGGGIANQLAVAAPDLAAAVAYYGQQPKADQVPRIKARLMLHYAGLDTRIDAGIRDFKAALDKAGTSYQLFMYEGANHAFNNDTSAARYDKPAAELAWSRTVGFLKETLG